MQSPVCKFSFYMLLPVNQSSRRLKRSAKNAITASNSANTTRIP